MRELNVVVFPAAHVADGVAARRFRKSQESARRAGETVGHPDTTFASGQADAPSAASFSRTASAWPLAFTLAQWWATLPSGPMMTVERMTPMVFLP